MVGRVLWVAPYRAFPLAAGYFAANLERAGQVAFRLGEYPRTTLEVDQTFIRDLLLFKPAVLGLSCFFWNTDENLMLARAARQISPHTTIVAGGPSVGVPADAEKLLRENPDVDAAICGEADFAFPRFVEHVLEGREPEAVEGLVRRGDGAKRPAVVDDLSLLPLVYDEANELVERHVSASSRVTLETLRGCRRSCHFCLYAGPVRLMPLERVEREIEYLCGHGVRHVRVADSHFGGSRKRALSLFASMARVNRETVFTIYPDPAHVDAEYLEAARAAGCRLVSFGVQTLDPETSSHLGRRTEQPRLERALVACRQAGRVPQVDLMFGLPGQGASDLIRDLSWLRARGANDVLLSPLMLFPGTHLAAESAGMFDVMDLPQRFARPVDSPADEYAAFLAIGTCLRVLSSLPRAIGMIERAAAADAADGGAFRAVLAGAPAQADLVLGLGDDFEAPAALQRRRASATARRAVELLRIGAPGRQVDEALLEELARVDALHSAMRMRHLELRREPGALAGGTLLLPGDALHRLRLELAPDVWLQTCDAPAAWAAPEPGGPPADAPVTHFLLDCREGRSSVLPFAEHALLSSFTRPRAPFERGATVDDRRFESIARWCERGVLRPTRDGRRGSTPPGGHP